MLHIKAGQIVPQDMEAWALESGYAEFNEDGDVVWIDESNAKEYAVCVAETRVYVVKYVVRATSKEAAVEIVMSGYGEAVSEDIKDTSDRYVIEVR